MMEPQLLQFVGDPDPEEARRITAATIYATAVAGRTDVDAGTITRGSAKIEAFLKDGTVIPKP